MDKLVKHAIRMLEIVEGENDFYRNDAKRQADIARAVYDTILRVQALERKADRKTEPSNSEKPNNSTISKMEQVEKPQTCDTCKYGEDKHRYAHICNECGVGINNYEPKDEPKTQMKTQNSNLTFEKADEPQTSGVVWTENEMPIYHSTTASTDEPQTKYKKWETKPNADIPTENTTCVGVAMALIEDEPTEDMWLNDADDERWSENEPQTDVYDYLGNGKWERR
jgi:hypothetical protein